MIQGLVRHRPKVPCAVKSTETSFRRDGNLLDPVMGNFGKRTDVTRDGMPECVRGTTYGKNSYTGVFNTILRMLPRLPVIQSPNAIPKKKGIARR